MNDAHTHGSAPDQARLAALRTNLTAVEQRLAEACASAGRSRDEVTLVVVTKTYPAADTRLLAGLGVRDVAENRDQDAAAKAEECRDLSLVWHFVGQLQTNKVRSVVRYADYVHSIDRLRLIEALSTEVRKAERPELGCLIQVALETPEESAETGSGGAVGSAFASPFDSMRGGGFPASIGPRGGASPDQVAALAEALAAAPGLRCDGLMAVAPLSGRYAGDPGRAFDRLAEISSRLRRDHPAATMVSAGMSGDLEQAIGSGATHVRVGTAVLGVRPPLG
jgi:uncharacterized pyridoxal phosphate-containing UPF0001 family protein